MVTVRLRALLLLPVFGGVLLLSACGNATDQPGSGNATGQPGSGTATGNQPTSAAPSSAAPTTAPTPSGGLRPGPTGIPIGTGKPITVDGIIEAGVEPGCRVLTAGSTMYLMLGGKDAPTGVPVRVEGVLQPGVLSTCQQGTPLRVTSVKRR
jgi:hypothetical protein